MYNNFTPEYTITGTDTLTPFQVWCQKVLPTIYDNSLSYYELLTKVVKYLNDTMMNVNDLSKDMTELHKAYEQLVAYVNSFKDYADGRMDNQDEKIQELTEKYNEFKNQVEYLIHEQDQKINKFVYTDAPNLIHDEVSNYTASQEFNEKVATAVEQSIGSGTSLAEISVINDKIGESKDAKTVFEDLETIKAQTENISISGFDDIDAKIGNSNDSQASETGGSVMGKLNLLIKTGGSGGSGGGGEIQVQSIVDNIGATTDTDGTATAGTIFAKENTVIENTETIKTSVNALTTKVDTTSTTTNTIKTDIGSMQTKVETTNTNVNSVKNEVTALSTKVGTTSDSGGTVSSGTLMGKVNALLQNSASGGGGGILGNGKEIKTRYYSSRPDSAKNLHIDGCGFIQFYFLTYSTIYQDTTTMIIDGVSIDLIKGNYSEKIPFTLYFNKSLDVILSDEITNKDIMSSGETNASYYGGIISMIQYQEN